MMTALTVIEYDKALKLLRQAQRIYHKLVEEVHQLKNERQVGVPGERGYKDIKEIAEHMEIYRTHIVELRAERDELLKRTAEQEELEEATRVILETAKFLELETK